ncbi:MAG: tetratricopeptide repeat protein [Kofleriaceae bacterium]|nr:tetratricopeptide repeat protein [Kofleriaceae bacterium]
MPRLPVCLLVMCTSGVAHAQFARFPRQQPAVPAPALSERVTPTPPPAKAQEPTKPSIDSDVVLSIDSLRGPVRSEQEQILVELIANTPDSEADEKSDYYFRLAELYAKQFQWWHDKAGDAQAANKAKEYLLRAVKAFKGLTDNERFRTYPKLDVALFEYAYTLQTGKYMKEARAVYDKLLKNHPTSKYIPEAHLGFGDYYFDAGQLADAEARYKMVLAFPKSTVYPYALYKLGWIHLQLQRTQEALESFYQVLAATKNEPKQAALARAARTDFVRAYASLGKTDRAFDVLQRVDKSATTELVELLGDLARDSGSVVQEANAYRDLMTRAPGDARTCNWQYRLAHATLALPGAAEATKVKEIETLVSVFAAQKEPDDECRANTEAMAGEMADAYHHEWSTSGNLEKLGYAERLYAAYVGAFPDDVDRRAKYAEVLWSHADHERNAKLRAETWERAAGVFATIGTPDATRAAALARLNGLDAVVPEDGKLVLAKAPRRAPRELPFKPADAKLVAAVAAYAKVATPDDELAQMRLVVAMTLRRYKHFDEAATVLDDFIAAHREHPRAQLAANLLLDSLVQARELDEVLQVADTMMADSEFIAGKTDLLRNIALLRSRRSR